MNGYHEQPTNITGGCHLAPIATRFELSYCTKSKRISISYAAQFPENGMNITSTQLECDRVSKFNTGNFAKENTNGVTGTESIHIQSHTYT